MSMMTILLLTVIAFANVILSGCTIEPKRRAEVTAASDPKACEQALSEGALGGNGFDDFNEHLYKSWLYTFCLTQVVKKNPEICIDVLAHGTIPVITSFSGPTKQQAQEITEYTVCNSYARDALEKRNLYTSRLNFDPGIYEGDANASNVVVGRIQSAQIENISTLGSTSGSQLGAGVGQVVYLESKKDLKGYNPWAQLGAGVAGAMVGSSLDKPGKVQFKKTYWIKTKGGDFISFGFIDIRPGLLPETMCAAIIDRRQIKQAKETLCMH